MKKFLLSSASVILSMAAFSQIACPSQFLRNNGNNKGCASHIRLYFNSCPTVIPTLDSIKIKGVLQPETFTVLEQNCHGSNIYVDYCISDDNLPPAARVTVFLTYRNGTTGAVIGNSTCDVASSGVTPVVLSNFSIKRNSSNEVSASWQTEQETGSSRFEIERAYDNASFQKIGSVLASGVSGALKTYTFADKTNTGRNVSFYRIKMIDKDGEFSYSETKSVRGSNVKSNIVVFPNPCRGNAKISLTDLSEPTDVQIVDVTGRLIKSVTLTNTNTTEINNLLKGTYFIRIVGKLSGESNVTKLSVIE